MYESQLIIRIPVEQDNISNFTHRLETDCNHPLLITDRVYKFLKAPLKNLNCDIPQDFNSELSEVIYNCYDAYAKNELTVGNALIITVAIQEIDDKVVVTIQDNAGGFTSANPTNRWLVSDIQPDEKDRKSSAGGERTGLVDFSSLLQSKSIGLFFSNAPSPTPGAIVTMEFPKQAERISSPGYDMF